MSGCFIVSLTYTASVGREKTCPRPSVQYKSCLQLRFPDNSMINRVEENNTNAPFVFGPEMDADG